MAGTSLADDAVSVLAAVRAMDEKMDLDHPERHSVRTLKRMAEQVLADAFRQAQGLAYLATDLTSIVDVIRDEEAEKAAGKGSA
jgi:hypothetical protein